MSIQASALPQTLKVIRNFYQGWYIKIKLLVCQRERHYKMWKVRSCLLRVCLESNLLIEFEYIRLYLILADTKTLRLNKVNSANGSMAQLTKCRKKRLMF